MDAQLGAVVGAVDLPPTDDGPLRGLTAGIKDLIAIAGQPRECGAPGIADPSPQVAHAPVVARLLAAGAAVVARTATHQLAYGIVTPQTRNPRAPDRIAGGSSGGTAAALAAGIVDVGLGSDTGGSVRIPAACCGVVGLKTTRGLVPLSGVQPLAWSLDTVGPMARTVAETALVLEAVAGWDPDDPYSDPAPLTPVAASPFRIGVPEQIRSLALDDDVRQVWERTLIALAADGARVERVDVPLLDQATIANGRILAAEAAAIHAVTLAEHGGELWPDVRDRLVKGATLLAWKVAEARHLGVRLRADLRAVFDRVDALVIPTLVCRTPTRDTDPVCVAGEPVPLVLAMTRLTHPWNLTGVPAGSVPAGADRDGAPVGVQVVGAWRAERTVLAVMAAIERLRA